MQDKVQKLVEVTEPQIFNPPKTMLVWDIDRTPFTNDIPNLCKRKVIAILPKVFANYTVLTIKHDNTYCSYKHCAEIPEEPKSRRATNRELAKWLAQCNGEMTFKSKSESDIDHLVFTSHCYEEENADEECDKALKRDDDGSWIVVRKWDDTEWHEPTVDYLGLEVK